MLEKKKCLLCKNIIVAKVPHTECLRMKDIIWFASNNVDIKPYMLEYKYNKDPQRGWISNVVNTLLKDKFKSFIINSMRLRE